MLSVVGFLYRTLTENGIYGAIGWFKNSRFRFLNSYLLYDIIVGNNKLEVEIKNTIR